jgi:hypothetical protein
MPDTPTPPAGSSGSGGGPAADGGAGNGSSPDSGTDVLTSLSTWLGSVLNDILQVMADAEGGPAMLAEFGWTGGTPVLPASLLARLDQGAQGSDPGAQSAESFASVVLALAALQDALEAARGGMDVASALEVLADILDVTVMLRLRRAHPVIWATLRLLSILSDDTAQLTNLGNLVSDTQQYLLGLTTSSEYAQKYQDWSTAILGAIGVLLGFIPASGEHGPNQTSFRSEVLYGWTAASANDHPNLVELLSRTMTWRLDAQVAGASPAPGIEEIVDLTFALVPPEHNQGSWGLFFRLSGATTLTIQLGTPEKQPDGSTHYTGWQVAITSTDGVALEMLFAGNGFIHGAGSGYKASIALERPDDISGSWVIGSKTGNHVEIQHARVAVTFSTDDKGALADVGAHADHIIFNIALGGDTFLGAVLPPSLRIDSTLGLGVDTRRGFYLDGGAALVVDLPVNVTIGPAAVLDLILQALHLVIAVTAADPNGDGQSGAVFSVALTVDAAVQVAGGVFTATVAGIGAAYQIGRVAAGSGSSSGSTGTGTGSTGTGTATGAGGGTGTTPAAGHWQPGLNFVPPTGLGMVVKAGPVTGGGFIGHNAPLGEYTGALQLKVQLATMNIGITALGQLDTKIPNYPDDWALLLILAATFQPGIQLGLGVSLTGLGGILGVNHAIDSNAIAAGLRTKALDAILFPPNPVVQAPHIFAVWKQTMPISVGHTVVGPMLALSWGGAANLCTLELALLIQLPSPVQVVLLGSFQLNAPSPTAPVIQLRADLLGELTFTPFYFLLQAVLVNSKLGTFTISGGMAIMAQGGSDAGFAYSSGGFNPQYTPPANFPALDRIRVDISPSSNPRLRLESYQAITSQTFQIGARAQLHAAAGPLAVDGWLGFDALIQWLPSFKFSAEISAGLSLSFDGSPVLEVSIDILLEGPGPWHLHGYASLSLLFVTLSLPIEATWGADSPPTSQTVQPLTLVRDALSSAAAWSASMPAGESSVVVLQPPAGPVIPAHPLAMVSCHQEVVPLGLTVTHVGNQPLAAPATVDVTGLRLANTVAGDLLPVTEPFAAAQFLNLTDDQALSKPSFEPMRAGLSAGGDAVDAGNATVVAATYKTVAVDGTTRTVMPPWLLDLTHAQAVLDPAAAPTKRPAPPQLSLLPDTLRTITGSMAAPQTASLAAQNAGGARLLDQVAVAGAPA